MSEENKGSIEDYVEPVEVEQDIDPELVDDRDTQDGDDFDFELPEYDLTQFELPDDEYEEEDDE